MPTRRPVIVTSPPVAARGSTTAAKACASTRLGGPISPAISGIRSRGRDWPAPTYATKSLMPVISRRRREIRPQTARDLAMAQRDHAREEDDNEGALGEADVVMSAAQQRQRAAQNRAEAAEQRALASQDRQSAAHDRDQAAHERSRARGP